MQYLVMLIGDGDMPPFQTQTPAEQAAAMGRFESFEEACAAREGVQILNGAALSDGQADATVMRTRGGKVTLTEGPYAEVLEGLGGMYLIDAPDLDVLVDLLRVLPPYDIQISPVVEAY